MRDGEERLDRVTGVALLAGAGLAMLAMALGTALMMVGKGGERPMALPPQIVFSGAAALRPADLLDAGILILVATPVVRVALLGVGFLWQRRYRFALVSAVVLGLLCVSFIYAAR